MSLLVKFIQKFRFSSLADSCVWTQGNSIISISELVGSDSTIQSTNNLYIDRRKTNTVFDIFSQQELQKMMKDDLKVFRCVTSAQIGVEMNLNINTLKADSFMKHLINLHESRKYLLKTARIIIDAEIGVAPSKNEISKNLVQLKKLFQDGLSLKIAMMISKRNMIAKTDKELNPYLELLLKKSKAINSNIVQLGYNLETIIYEQGYRLQHIFLTSYNCQFDRIQLLADNKAYDLRQVLMVTGMIGFRGKIILYNSSQFEQNFEYLQQKLKETGYVQNYIDEVQQYNQVW